MRSYWMGLLSICIFAFLLPAYAADGVPSSGAASLRILQGSVVDTGGMPVSGVRVDIRDSEDNILADTLTDADGKFALFGIPLPVGSYLMHASAVGYEADEKTFEIGGDTQASLNFSLTLKIAAKVRGISSRFTVVRIYYATDRKQEKDGQSVRYTGTRSDGGALSYGSCEVSIPETHTFAELERPSIWRFEFRVDPEKHVMLRKIEAEAKDQFFKEMSASVAASPTKDAFVFVHGYNVSFEAAATRTAQLAYDFGFKGAPIMYSWPSKASLFGYLADEENATQTVGDLKQFLAEVASNSGATVVHLIAHSMGNRALLPAVAQLAADPHFKDFKKFHDLVSAAPDVDRDDFMKLIAQIQKPTNSSIALYVSQQDQALAASHLLFHKEQRAGEGGVQSVVMAGVDTVDVSNISTDALGHSYYGDSRSVVSDLLEFFEGKHPPRPGLTRVAVGNLGYWLLRPTN
ncbi:MAG: alpha/beta hydrolase [Candidatus Korobacteraceae bacterium]